MKLRISRQEWAWGLKVSIPVAVCLATGALVLFAPEEDRVLGRGRLMAAGVSGKWSDESEGQRMRTREARNATVAAMRMRLPLEGKEREIRGLFGGAADTLVVERFNRDLDLGGARDGWDFLGSSVRREIDSTAPAFGRWKRVIIHGSGSAMGSASALSDYHRRVQGLEDGMAYHFVVGNGSGSALGEIEVGERWAEQRPGLFSDASGGGEAIEVCLVGDFRRSAPDEVQLKALEELLAYLRAKVGEISVEVHGDGRCLGAKFARELVTAQL